jgi:curved DNA-binding protein CbpA
MENAFERLGLEPGLCYDDEVLRAAFREAGKREHPDAGGSEEGFARLRAAFELLSSPSRRLRHWIEWRGLVVEPRGVVGSDLMDLFGRVGEVTQRADVLARKRADTRSALGLALLEGEVQRTLEEVAAVVGEVDAAIARETSGFAGWERSEAVEVEALARAVRNLAFLEKWRHALRSIPPRLV